MGWNDLVDVVELVSPIEPLDSRNRIEVAIPAQKGKIMLPTEGCNPEVIRRNWLSGLSQLNVDSCIMMGGLLGDVQHSAVSDETIHPTPIPSPMARLGDPITIFPEHHDRERELPGTSQNLDNAWMFLCSCGKCVCIQDQSLVSEAHTSGSISSNASSITLFIRSVSLRRSLSLPMCFIQGF